MNYEEYSHPAWLDELSMADQEQALRFMSTGEANESFLQKLDKNPQLRSLIDAEMDRRLAEVNMQLRDLDGSS